MRGPVLPYSWLALAQFVVLSVVAVAVLVVASFSVTQVAFALGAHLIELRGAKGHEIRINIALQDSTRRGGRRMVVRGRGALRT